MWGAVKDKEAHAFTDHWYFGYESCTYQNYSLRTCSCGYSYTYHKPHQSGEYWNYSVPRGRHWKSCKVCGSWTENGECVDANKKRLTCKNPGTCVVCGRTRTSGYHFLINGKCRDCGKIFFTYTKPKVSYNSDYSGCVVTFSITPVDSQAYLTGEYGDYTSGVYKSGTTSIKRLQDGTIEYTCTYTFNPLINSKVSSTVGNNESMVKINGYRTWTESFGISWTVWQDHQAPVQNDVIQKDQASANGWATIKQLTLSGTEDFSDIVYLTVSDKSTGEKYVTNAAVPVTSGKYSYTCTPSIEGDANGRTYVVAAKDQIGNTSTKEFVVSKTDGSHPQLKSGTSLTYTDWSTSKNISLNFFDFGSGGVQASLDNQTDYKPLTKSGEYYVWNHSFGNQVGITEHTIYVRDALGNAGLYKLTVGNTDSTNYKITYNLDGGSMSGQPTSYNVESSTFTLPTPTKTGHIFTGWTGSNGTTPQKTVTVNKGTRGNLSYTANWSANQYENYIHHWAWGFKNGEGNNNYKSAFHLLPDTSFKITYGNTFVLNEKNGTRIPNGFRLRTEFGTGSVVNGAWKIYNFNTSITQKAGQMYFEYDYEQIPYSITYNLNGGANNSLNPSTYGVLYGVSLKAPTRAGYTFTGWYDENGNRVTGINEGCNATFSSADDLYAKLAKRTTGNRTLTAHWSYNPVSVKVPQVLTGDHTGKSQFRIKCAAFLIQNNFVFVLIILKETLVSISINKRNAVFFNGMKTLGTWAGFFYTFF